MKKIKAAGLSLKGGYYKEGNCAIPLPKVL